MKNIIYAMMYGLENALGFTRCNSLPKPQERNDRRRYLRAVSGLSGKAARRRAKKLRYTARSHPWQRRKRVADQ